ncbi:MAG: DUF1902 domain-containing protein [Gluconacetobacter diazotrophicus]|nr:DUF1902 domain-containing protein [Gluconacetobacter diazotrophicus]
MGEQGHPLPVTAPRDPEGRIYVATGADVPGLVAEAPTLDTLSEKVLALIPELIELNSSPAIGHWAGMSSFPSGWSRPSTSPFTPDGEPRPGREGTAAAPALLVPPSGQGRPRDLVRSHRRTLRPGGREDPVTTRPERDHEASFFRARKRCSSGSV